MLIDRGHKKKVQNQPTTPEADHFGFVYFFFPIVHRGFAYRGLGY